MDPLTEQQFKDALPAKVKKSVNAVLMNQVNNTLSDPDQYEFFKENLVSYTNVMMEGRFKVSSYINAVKYVSFKLMGSTNISAYTRTFPDKYARHLRKNISKKNIASYATSYNKSKLVNLIFEQTLVPSHVLNQPMFQEALNVLANLMVTARSEKVRSDSANSILTHLKRPEAQKIELDIGVKRDKTLDILRATTLDLVNAQKKQIIDGNASAKQIAEGDLVIINPEEEDAVNTGS